MTGGRPANGMRQSRVVGPEQSALVEIPTPEPGMGQVLVRVQACGVCASELHPWQDPASNFPLTLGHEVAGVVEAVGSAVTRLRRGDRVTGLMKAGYSDFQIADEQRLLVVPDAVQEQFPLGEPLACLVNGARRTPVELGARVAIIGLGFMGLGFLQLLKLRGPSRTIVVDVQEAALERALALGADEAYAPGQVPPAYLLSEFADWQSDRGVDVVVEASGTQAGLTLAGEMVRAHGCLSILGYHQGGDRSVDVQSWNWKAIDVVNAHVRRQGDLMESMRIGLDLMASGLFSFGGLVSHPFGLPEVDEAFRALRDKPPGFVKAVVVP